MVPDIVARTYLMEQTMVAQRNLRIAVIGAGASGILAVIKLRAPPARRRHRVRKGARSAVHWRDNRYPGRHAMSPAPIPVFVRAQSGLDPRLFARSGNPRVSEIGCSETRCRTLDPIGNEVTRAEFIKASGTSTPCNPQGVFDVVLTAVGVLHHPVYPDIAGARRVQRRVLFTHHAGTTRYRSKANEWGIIGTGSVTATQIVGGIIDDVAKLAYSNAPRSGSCPCESPYSDEQKEAFREDPGLMEAEYARLAVEFNSKFAAAVVGANPAHYEVMSKLCEDNLRDASRTRNCRPLTPNYKVGCKRLIMSDQFYSAIQRPHAELVTDGIARIEATGIRTVDGRLHELDVLVFATGFDTHRFVRPMNVIGRDGRRLDDAWAHANEGYLGITIPGFPNWFMLGGPNSPIGNCRG